MQKKSKISLICLLLVIFCIFSNLSDFFEDCRLIKQIKVSIVEITDLEEEINLIK